MSLNCPVFSLEEKPSYQGIMGTVGKMLEDEELMESTVQLNKYCASLFFSFFFLSRFACGSVYYEVVEMLGNACII